MVLLCDGRLTCGCADPYGRRILGDARTTSVTGVWTGEVASSLRRDIVGGGSKFCGDCPLKLPLKKDEAPPARSLDAGALPGRLYVECTAACNISCNQACCAPETGITRTRQAGMLDFDLFTRVIDEAGPTLGRVDFFNYGEQFLHKRAVEMCEYIKSKFPQIYLYTSTNGLALNEEKARRLVHSGIDEVTFSIDGASQDTYVQYRQRGRFRQGAGQPGGHGRREGQARSRRAAAELALHPLQVERSRRRDERRAAPGGGHRRRSPLLGGDGPPRRQLLAALPSRHRRLRGHRDRGLGPQQSGECDPRGDATRAD